MEKDLTLCRPPVSLIQFDGRRYRLQLSFDRVLAVFAVWREDILSMADREELMAEILAGRAAGRLTPVRRAALLREIMERFISSGESSGVAAGVRLLDFEQDAAYILASFRAAYGIDLNAERGRMDWRVFLALFRGLPDDSKIKEIMRIRKRPIPAQSKSNADEIKALLEAKAFYALHISEDEAERAFQASVDRLAEGLIHRARAGD